jgi:hypothetical protein
VDVVNRIVSDFRDGQQDVAEFWIDLGGKLVHIRYFAVRNENREYLGTLEVTQDLTPLRALEGERRLLQYEGNGEEKQTMEKKEHEQDTSIPLDAAPHPDSEDTSWIADKEIIKTIDADEMLARGVHPLTLVMELVRGLGEKQSIVILSSFRPEPLIDAVRAAGSRAHCQRGDSGRFETTIAAG